MTDGAVPTSIDHDESAALHIGRGDLQAGMISHFAADRERHKEVVVIAARATKYRWIGHGFKIAVAGVLAFLGIFGKDILSSVFDRATRPILEEQTAAFSKQVGETIGVSIKDLKSSIDKATERIDRLEQQGRERRPR